jgi:hypothetical protein
LLALTRDGNNYFRASELNPFKTLRSFLIKSSFYSYLWRS